MAAASGSKPNAAAVALEVVQTPKPPAAEHRSGGCFGFIGRTPFPRYRAGSGTLGWAASTVLHVLAVSDLPLAGKAMCACHLLG